MSVVTGGRVRLSRFGPGSTQARLDSSVSAKLVFSMKRIRRVRPPPDEDAPEHVLTVEGKFALVGRPPEARFTAAQVPTHVDGGDPLDAPPDASATRRQLRLEFDSAQFPDLGDGILIVLPKRIERTARFLELSVALEINGNTEASDTVNDRLDVPISAASPPQVPAFEVRLLDDVATPLPGIELSLDLEGNEVAVRTDDMGIARLHGQPATLALARLPSAKSLKAQLKSRWNEVRPSRTALDSQQMERIALGPDIEPRALELDRPLTISLCPRVERARLLGFFFDTNKTFLLPDSDGGAALRILQSLYQRNSPSQLLIVGHADTTGGAAYNDKLSLERAETLLDYLKDNVDGWIKWYGNDIESKKRWGASEDLHMISALPDGSTRDGSESPVTWFQRTRGLRVDGKAGPETRRALVGEYMSLDSATLPPEITATTHGCGANFQDVPSANGTGQKDNRRVELFFFDNELGIQPPPTGTNSKADANDYPEWVRRAHAVEELTTQRRTLVIKILDALNEPLFGAPYELAVGDELRTGKTDERGFLHERDVFLPNRCTLKWGYPPPPDTDEDARPEDLCFESALFLDYAEVDDTNVDEAARRRLGNLGYRDPALERNVQSFQKDFGIPAAAWFDQKTFDELRRVHDEL